MGAKITHKLQPNLIRGCVSDFWGYNKRIAKIDFQTTFEY